MIDNITPEINIFALPFFDELSHDVKAIPLCLARSWKPIFTVTFTRFLV